MGSAHPWTPVDRGPAGGAARGRAPRGRRLWVGAAGQGDVREAGERKLVTSPSVCLIPRGAEGLRAQRSETVTGFAGKRSVQHDKALPPDLRPESAELALGFMVDLLCRHEGPDDDHAASGAETPFDSACA